MKITKFGHACLLIEEKGAKLLVDPGGFSSGFEDEQGIAAVLYTHQHGDHFDADKLAAVKRVNPDARIIADAETAELIKASGGEVEVAANGSEFDVAGIKVEGIGHDHAIIHSAIPGIRNVGYLIAGRLFHPGDALTEPDRAIEILALPIVAPWSKIQETADYLAAVKPKIAFPIHDAVASTPDMYMNMVGGVTKDLGIELKPLAAGGVLEV